VAVAFDHLGRRLVRTREQVDGAVSVLCDVQNTLVNNVFRVRSWFIVVCQFLFLYCLA
jgi:hypothetical protein